MIRFSNRTQAKPTTEMIVSITDQVLMVCPSTCLKPPPAATISRKPAMGGSEPPITAEV